MATTNDVTIFGQTVETMESLATSISPSILPKDISSEAEALILMAPPVQIFDKDTFNTNTGKRDMFYIGESDTEQYVDTLLYKRYIDDFGKSSGERNEIYNSLITEANGEFDDYNYKGNGTGTIYIPFMRCMVQCTYAYHNTATYETVPDAIIFNAFDFQNQNIGRLNLNTDTISNPAIDFNKSPSEESIMYNVVKNELDQVNNTIITGRTINSWYYSTKTGLTIKYNPNAIFIEDLRVVAF